MTYGGWGARIRTWDHGTKARCLTAWPRPNPLRRYARFALRLPDRAAPGERYNMVSGCPPSSIGRLEQRTPFGKPGKPPKMALLRPLALTSIYGDSASRSVAQSGSAPRSGRGGRRFKSCHSDHLTDAPGPDTFR
jgi:hypothetical protein